MEDAAPERSRSSFSIWKSIPWALILVSGIGIFYMRLTAIEDDFAKANLISGLLTVVIWMCLVAGLYAGNYSRSSWKVVFWLPVLALVGILSIYKYDGLDGELIPQFTPRWEEQAKLPAVQENSATEASLFRARETDFPQFFGPDRNGILINTALDFDWANTPPEIAWKQPIGMGWAGFAVQGDVAVTMEQRDQKELVSAYSMQDGALIWTYEIDAYHHNFAGGTGPRCTPAISNGKVYACSAVSQFVCLDLETGAKVWSHELLEMASTNQADFESGVSWGRAGSPLVIEDKVLIPFGGTSTSANLIAFNAENGEEAWRAGQGQVSYSSPSLYQVSGTPQILLFAEKQLVGYSTDGQVLWTYDWPANSNADPAVSQPVQIGDNAFFISKGYGTGGRRIELNQANDGSWSVNEVWKSARILRTKFTNCVYLDGHVYGLSDGILECVDAESGKKQWKRGRYGHGQLLLVNDYLVISAESGELVLVQATPDKFEELAKIPVIGDVTWNPLTLSGNRLLMRNGLSDGAEAACVLLPTLQTEETSTEAGDESIQ